MSRRRLVVAAVLVMAFMAAMLPSSARPAGPAVPSIDNLVYKPDPEYATIPATPDPEAVPKPNPGGNWNAYDLNAFETIWFPTRQAGDADAKAAPGGAIAHGVCAPPACENHSLEFVKFWTKAMGSIVEPFGGTARAYKFENVGGEVPPYVFATPSGDAFNVQATIPGAVHPEQMVIVSGHYDQTQSGPASAWDSAEGHATVFRIAKLMTDYWRKTGTRPATTVKFTAWAGEESGSNGSAAYIRDNIQPFPNLRTLGYFNLDPCAGAYPAFYRGNPAYQVKMVMQLTNPDTALFNKAGIKQFNKQARDVLGDVMNHLDDKLTDVPTEPEIFISDEEAEKNGTTSQESMVITALGGLRLFTSDYRNFEGIGVPIFNLFPDMLGPHAGPPAGDPGWHTDGIALLHTPNDNLRSLNALTGVDQSGLTASQGWYKGLEFCAHMHSWFMLQPNMGGAAKRTDGPVAYFEALHEAPAPLAPKKALTFDATGSHAWDGAKLVDPQKLRYVWDFDDGSRGEGGTVKHSFSKAGTYRVQLTVIAPGGRKDTMELLVKIG
ncbi:MAG: M28 family peptidase [Actinomycetota bacterium]